MADIPILKTGLLYEAEMLAHALRDGGVPHYQRIENFCGLEFAMDPLPVQGPGIFFKVLVPEGAAEDAREILASLPITPGTAEIVELFAEAVGQKIHYWNGRGFFDNYGSDLDY